MQRPAASSIDATLLRNGDPLALPLSDKRALELGDCDTSIRQRLHEVQQVAGSSCDPIHAVHNDCVAGSDEPEQRLKFRALRVVQ